jgi:hypothetical protein
MNRENGNFALGICGGLLAAIAAAVIWAALTAATNFQIGYMAVGVGFIVAFAMRFAGRGHDKRFAYAGALLSLAGCVMGNFLAACAIAANTEHASIMRAIAILLPHFADVMKDTFNVMDLLFYAMGAYFGYKYAVTPPRARAVEEAS